jgi:hypothetical protein
MESHKEDLARILVPTYLDGIDDLPLDEIRAKRSECQQIEVALSYLRRLIQGRLDIVFAYVAQAENGETLELANVVDDLPGILTAGTGSRGAGRLPLLLAPDTEDYHLTSELDAILGADEIVSLPGRDLAELQDLATRLSVLEKQVSAERRGLHERIDTLQAELVDRYKSGRASVDGLLA